MSSTDTVITRKENLADGVCVAVAGDIDLSRSPTLRVELMQLTGLKPKRLVIDLAEVPYMDSSGVATLVEALQQQRRNSGKMVLCALQPKVKSIFEIARLTMVFSIVATVEDAKAV